MGNFQKLIVVFAVLILSHSAQASAPSSSSEIFYENASGSPIFKLLQSAKSTIDIEIYEIQDTRVHAAVLKAMDRGVKVRVIQESEAVSSGCTVFDKVATSDSIDCKIQKNFIQQVRAKGGAYVPFAYQQFCGDSEYRCLEHGKMILVDHQKALISTGNFNASNLCDPKGLPKGNVLSTCNRDYTILSTDPNVVSTLSAIFDADFKSKSYNLASILKTKSAQKITVSPYSLSPLLQFIRSAKQSILVENQYLKNADLVKELVLASKKGVQVYVVVNSICSFGKPDPAQDASAINLWKNVFRILDQAGVKSRAFTRNAKINGYNAYIHSKAIVVDGIRAWVGSVNGSTQALTMNREYGIFLNDPKEVLKLGKYIASDFNDRHTESWQESLQCKKDF